jgi:hypothetical protein
VCSGVKGSQRAQAGRLRLIVEAVDPAIVVLLDERAAADFSRAFDVEAPRVGVVEVVGGRRVLAVEDFAASLADEALKRRAWAQLKALAGPAEG